MSEFLSTEAIVLRGQDYRESDQLLTVLTRTRGKMRVLAKGVKKTQSKLRGGLLLFGETNLTLTLGKGIPVVTNAEGKQGFSAIRNDFTKMSYASYCAELVDALLAEEEEDRALYDIVLSGMERLSSMEPWMATKITEFQLLEQMGYRLHLHTCVACGKKLNFSNTNRGVVGGVLCQDCPQQEMQSVVLLSMETQALLRAMRALPLGRLSVLAATRRCRNEVDRYLDLQLSQILDRPLKTKQFINSMQKK